MSIDKWNYRNLGFDSLEEMNESIERVKAEERLTPHELAQKRHTPSPAITEGGGLDFEALKRGARLERLDATVKAKLFHDKDRQRLEAENKAKEELRSKLSDSIVQTKQAEAEAEFNKQKQKIEADLQKEIYARHGLNTSYQDALDEGYRSLLEKIQNNN